MLIRISHGELAVIVHGTLFRGDHGKNVGDLMRIGEEVAFLELKILLHAIKDSGSAVGVRFRMAGQLWSNNFCKVLTISDIGVALLDQHNNKLHFIRELGHVMQFELDSQFQSYQPNFHYNVAWEHSATATAG